MTTRLEVTAGADRDYPLQCWNEGAQTTPVFDAEDLLTASVSPGEGRPALFTAEVDWWTAPDPITHLPTQTGYDQGQVLLSLFGADTATLEPETGYTVEIWRQPTGSTRRYCVWRGSLVAAYAAAAGRPRLPTYCTYKDMLDFGPWCRYLQDTDVDEAAFYDRRFEARLWLDDLIVKSFRGSALYPFGTAAVPHQYWSGWSGPWRSAMPSTWVRDQLWGGQVVGMPTITAPGIGYSWPPPIDADPPLPSTLPQVALRQKPATFVSILDGTGGLGAILVSDPGFGYAPGSVLPLNIGGDGTGAMATARVSAGALFLRDQVRRIVAYKALALLGLAQIGNNPQHVAQGQYCAAKASEELSSFTAEMDLNNDGMPDTAIPVYLVNTIYM